MKMNYRYIFFGTPHIAALSLQALIRANIPPVVVVTAPARPQGRGMHLTDTPVAVLAREHSIPVLTPEKITPDFIHDLQQQGPWDFFFVVAYGKILPTTLLDLANGKVLNLHPSLLPKYRGPSPLESVLLSDDTETGVTLMELDREIDHGPIVAQSVLPLPTTETIESLTEKSAPLGVELLTRHIESYLSGTIPPPQDHALSTDTRKYTKADGLITNSMSDWQKWKRYRAFGDRGWVHFNVVHQGKDTTVKITNASYADDAFVIEEVVPENGKRQSYETFVRSYLHTSH